MISRVLAAALLLPAVIGAAAADDGQAIGAGVRVVPLDARTWMHVSEDPSTPGVTANGLVIQTGDGSLLIDTGWSTDQTRRILDWAENDLGRPVRDAIVTHAHRDRWGGLAALNGRSIVIHGHAFTSSLARALEHEPLHWTFEFQERLTFGGETVELFYPGPAHARDNIAVYFPDRRLLFGGCMVRELSATGLGFAGDADLEEWRQALRRLIDRYHDIETVVPGHGAAGGAVLLSQTMHLLEEARAYSSTLDK